LLSKLQMPGAQQQPRLLAGVQIQQHLSTACTAVAMLITFAGAAAAAAVFAGAFNCQLSYSRQSGSSADSAAKMGTTAITCMCTDVVQFFAAYCWTCCGPPTSTAYDLTLL
jgi:hypothetical protein